MAENYITELSKGQALTGVPQEYIDRVLKPRYTGGIKDGIFTPSSTPGLPQGYYVPADEGSLPKPPDGSPPFFAVVTQNGPFMINPQPSLSNNMNLTGRSSALMDVFITGKSTTWDLVLFPKSGVNLGGLVQVRAPPLTLKHRQECACY